jgi:hypothetical protein
MRQTRVNIDDSHCSPWPGAPKHRGESGESGRKPRDLAQATALTNRISELGGIGWFTLTRGSLCGYSGLRLDRAGRAEHLWRAVAAEGPRIKGSVHFVTQSAIDRTCFCRASRGRIIRGAMKTTHFAKPHVYIVLFRCDRCSGPMLSRVISEGPYPPSEMKEHPFSVACPICAWSGKKTGSEAELILPVIEWKHSIHFEPPRS